MFGGARKLFLCTTFYYFYGVCNVIRYCYNNTFILLHHVDLYKKERSHKACETNLMTSLVVDRALQILISLTLFGKDIYRNYLIIS